MEEQGTHKPLAVGSTPTLATKQGPVTVKFRAFRLLSCWVNSMNFRKWIILAIAEGLICILVLLIPASKASATVFLRYSFQRLVLVFAVVGIIAVILFFNHLASRQSPALEKPRNRLLEFLQTETNVRGLLLVGTSGALVCLYLLISWSTIDPLYQGIILKITPILIWFLLIGVQTVFGIVSWGNDYNREYQTEIIPINQSVDFIREIGIEIFVLLVIIGSQLAYIPHRFWEIRPLVLKFSPLIIFGLIVLARLIPKAYQKISKHQPIKFVFAGVLLIGFITLGATFYNTAEKHSREVNSDLLADQSAYVKFSYKAAESGFRYTGNRNQMPLYLFLQALFINPDNDREQTFWVGKQVNIVLTIILLVALFFFVRKYLPLFETTLLVLITAFSVFIFKSAYFTAENLYYFLSFVGFAMMCRMLIKPNLSLALVTGFVLGLGHLTKASIIPGLMIFLVVYAIKLIFEKFENWRSKLIQGFVVLAVFMVTLLPYGLESKKTYGDFFYNVNYIVMWYDTWEQAVAQADHSSGDPEWHKIPSEEISGPRKYLQEHSAAQIRDRIFYGIHRQTENIRYQFNFFNYPVIYFLAVGLLFLFHANNGWQLIKGYYFLIGFVLLFLVGYFSSFVWYSAIASLWRFIYGLHLPFMFSMYISINCLVGKPENHLSRLINFIVTIMLVLDIWYVLEIGLFLQNFAS